MSDTVLVALLSLAGTAIGSLIGIITNNKLIIYRLEQLEKKVEKHNSVIERVALLEKDTKTAFQMIYELKEGTDK
ncbi:MAG: hypothetical protein ACOYI3_03945 [Christensenellales bacterium]|jgi:hypothetical protein